jgi:hypothetical protein
MSDALSSSHAGTYAGFGTKAQGDTGSARTLYQLGTALQGASQVDDNIAPLLPVQPVLSLTHDRSVAELAIKQLGSEIEHAQQELAELENDLVQEVRSISVRGWLLPLMVIGLLLSLYGSLTSSTSAELGATGLMLLWSLSAFWLLYTRERRREMTERAYMAEIEIWSKRIEELRHSLEHNQWIVEVADSMEV